MGLRIAVAGAAVFLLWRILHVNAVVYGDENRPALRLAPASPVGEIARALRANPADLGALLLLALRHEEAGDSPAASKAYAGALSIAPLDRTALGAVARFELRRGRLAEGLAHLDRLASLHPPARSTVFPLMAALLGAQGGVALFGRVAAEANWSAAFLEFACARGADPRTLAPLLMRRLAAGRTSGREAGCVIDRMRQAGHVDEAYQLWLNTLPRARHADVGFVFNGGFEGAPGGFGFDWILAAASPALAVDYARGPGVTGERALRVAYSGKRLSGPAARQYLAVAPGTYRLEGRARLEGLQSVRGIQWVLRCSGPGAADRPLASSGAMPGSGEWQRFGFPVVIPRDCPAQVLELEPVGLREGTTFVSGRAWFDDLRLARSR